MNKRDALSEERLSFFFNKLASKRGFQRIHIPTIVGPNLIPKAVNLRVFEVLSWEKKSLGFLRPECTLQLCHWFSENYGGLSLPYKVRYVEECFRHEKEQRGRFRQFCQAGVEVLRFGRKTTREELSEVIQVLHNFFKSGLPMNNLRLASLKPIKKKIKEMGLDEAEVLSMLDSHSKEVPEGLKGWLERPFEDFLEEARGDPESYEDLFRIKQILDFYPHWASWDPKIVRGLAYYDGVTFEVSPKIGGKSLAGGGEFSFPGTQVKGVGMGIGISRCALNLSNCEDQPLEVVTNRGIDAEREPIIKSLNRRGLPYCLVSKPKGFPYLDLQKRILKKSKGEDIPYSEDLEV